MIKQTDSIDIELEELANNAELKKVRNTARGFLRFYREGSVGSNSTGLIYFLQQPIDYTTKFGDTIIGVI